MDILDLMKETSDNFSYTENDMQGYKTTSSNLVDLFFKISSYRNLSDNQLVEDFKKLLNSEDYSYALRFLFYIRDIRNGLGERRLFRVWLKELLNKSFEDKDIIIKDIIYNQISNYGRYDDLFVFINTKYEYMVIDFIKQQLKTDLDNMKNSKSISLLAKWMPSENTSCKETVKLARHLIKKLDISVSEYRKTLSQLRKYLKVVETLISSNKWEEIDYNNVPSLANLKYKDAFLKHDTDRRIEYLHSLIKEESNVKINSSVNFPHSIVNKYRCVDNYDETLEQLWKNLKQVEGLKDTIVVRDGSWSMTTKINNSNITCLDVANGLTIYCAEHLKDNFKNKFITFSSKAQVVSLSNKNTLYTKLLKLDIYNDCSNTNIERVFNLLLKTAIDNKVSQESLPKKLLIISDMEFDSSRFNYSNNVFENAKEMYNKNGYELPQLVFWNVCSRTNTIPYIKDNVLLISGFSQNVLDLVLSNVDMKTTLINKLNSQYNNIRLLK